MTFKAQCSRLRVDPERQVANGRLLSMSDSARRALVACLLLLSSLSAAAEFAPSRAFSEMILGSWRESIVMGEVTSSGVSVYSPDSTVTHDIKVVGPGVTIEVQVRSRWRIEGSELITEVLHSSRPDAFPVGTIERDTIVLMEKNRWVYRDSDGVEVTAIRVDDGASASD